MIRRYIDACLTHTITTKSGAMGGASVADGRGLGVSEGRATYTDEDGNVVGHGASRGASAETWREVVGYSERWAETTAVDNSTTPQCRAMLSDIEAARGEVDRIMAEADQEAVRQNVWTWLQTDVPRRLAEEIWR